MSTAEIRGLIATTRLLHVGIKGMKWGIRKEASSKQEKHHKKFQKSLDSREVRSEFHNTVLPVVIHHHLPILEKKYAADIAAGNLSNPNHSAHKAYNKDLMDAYVGEINKLTGTLTDKTGTKRVKAVAVGSHVTSDPKNWAFRLVAEDVTHADTALYVVEVVTNDNGTAKDLKMVPDSLVQTTIADILSHSGVKGMKWGVRKEARSRIAAGQREVAARRAASKAHDVTVSQKGRKKLRATGGVGHPAHAEAIRTKELGQIAKKSGFQALSNKELQDYTTRLNLETNAKRLDSQRQNAGRRFVGKFLGEQGKSAANQAGNAAVSIGVKKGLMAIGLAAL